MNANLFLIAIGFVVFSVSRCRAKGLFITLSFDDNLIEHFRAGETLSQLGMKGTFYVNSGRLGTNDKIYLSATQVQDLQSMGHEIGGHTIDHANLLSSSNSVRRKQICNDKMNLENIGLTISSFAFPFGANFDGAENIITECGYSTARDSGGILTPDSCRGCPSFLRVPLNEPFLIRSISYRLRTGNERIIDIIEKGLQDTTRDDSFGWIIFIFHEIGDLPDKKTSISKKSFEHLLAYLQRQEDIAVVTTYQIKSSDDYNALFNQYKVTSDATNINDHSNYTHTKYAGNSNNSNNSN